MSKNKVEISGLNTSDLKVLTDKEMNDLFDKMHKGDTNARNLLVEGNLKLVLSILRKYNNRVDNMDDLFQVGCIGLVKAIDHFDNSYNVKLSTYAVPMILGEVKRYLRDNTSVRISRSIKDLSYKIMQVKDYLTNELSREPTIGEMAKFLNINESDISIAINSMKDSISLFEPIYSDGGDTIYLEDQLEDKKNKMKSINDLILLREALNNLKNKEKFIINERYIIGKTQMELAKELNISQAQISRIETNAIKIIKRNIK